MKIMGKQMSPIARNLLCAVALNLALIAPSQADDVSSFKSGISNMSLCGPGDPAVGMKRFYLIPWFAAVQKKIKEQSTYEKLTAELESYGGVDDAGSSTSIKN